jgi:hypothetical protein
LPVP